MNRPVFPAVLALCEALLAAGTGTPERRTGPAGPSPAAAGRAVLEFSAPRPEAPSYRIRFPFQVGPDRALVRSLTLNGAAVRSFLIFSGAQPMPSGTPLDPGAYEIVADYAWAGGKSYEAAVEFQPERASKPRHFRAQGVSPGSGGIPGGQEGFYRSYEVEESAGLERREEIVHLTLTAPRDEIKEARLVLYDGSRRVPFEVVETGEFEPPAKAGAAHPATITQRLAFQLSASPWEKRRLLLLRGDSPEPPAGQLRVSGEGLGRTIRTSRLTLGLSPKSGQLNTLEAADPAIRISNKVGVIHWNPDVFVQGLAWDHSFDWDPPAAFAERSGGLVYVNSRSGPLPRLPDVRLAVKYTVEAGAPYFVSETRLDFDKDLGVIAVRNDEMVLDKELFDTLVYKDRSGALVRLPLREKLGLPFGLAHCAPADLDWVGLVNTASGLGFFSLRIAAVNGNFEPSDWFPLRAGTCFYAPSDGSYVYWVRPLVYTWDDFFTNTLHAFVPKGSFFYEKNAYGVWAVDGEWIGRLDEQLRRLRAPLRVY